MGRLLGGVALQVWIFAFIVFFGAETVLLEPQLRVVAQLVFGVPLVLWALLRVRRRPDVLDWAVIGALVLYLAVSIASRDRTGSLESLALVSLYALLFWSLRDAVRVPRWRERIGVAVGTAMAFSLALNAALLIREKVEFWAATGTLPQLEGLQVFPWETVNALPVLVLIGLPFVAWMPRGVYRRVVLGVMLVASCVVVPFSNGRAGYLGLAIAAVALAAMSEWPRRWFVARPVRWRRAVVMAAVVIAAVVAWRGLPLFIDAVTSSGRGELYGASAHMFTDRPVLGSGPGTYSWARLLYGDETARLLPVRLTHDVPLQTLVDGGVLLALALGGLVAGWARTAFGWRLPLPRRVAVAALIGFAAAELFDDFSFLPSVTAMVVCLAVLALPAPSPQQKQAQASGPIRFAPLAAGALGLALSLPFALGADVARASGADGRAAAVRGNWSRAVTSFASATAAHPEDGGYWLALAQSRAELGDLLGARDAYETARATSPGDARAYGGLAALGSDAAERLALLRRAAELTTGDPQYAYRLGVALAESGDVRGAAAAWGRAADLQSISFGILPFNRYGIDPVLTADAAAAHAQAAPRPDADLDDAARWDVTLSLDRLPADAGAAWLAVDAARRGEMAAAQRLARVAVDTRPFSARSYEALAAVAAFGCDARTVDEALRLEKATRDAWNPPPPEVAVRREFVYREASIGAMQPPGTANLPVPERWPWSVINERPGCER